MMGHDEAGGAVEARATRCSATPIWLSLGGRAFVNWFGGGSANPQFAHGKRLLMVTPAPSITLSSMRKPMPLILLCFMLLALASVCFAQASAPTPMLARQNIPLNENAAYSWFSEPRAIIQNDKLIVGSVRAIDTFRAGQSDPTWGSVEVSVCDLKTGAIKTTVLHRYFDQDD